MNRRELLLGAVAMPLPDLARHYAEADTPKGEVVVVIGLPSDEALAWSDARIDAALRDALASHSVKDAAALVASASGVAKKVLYSRAMELREADA
jgi:16S rRNA (cytidine1402-2'-O)-methyltransferase